MHLNVALTSLKMSPQTCQTVSRGNFFFFLNMTFLPCAFSRQVYIQGKSRDFFFSPRYECQPCSSFSIPQFHKFCRQLIDRSSRESNGCFRHSFMRRSTGTLRGNQSRFTVDSFSLRRSRAALTIFLLQHKRSSIFLLRCTPGVYHPPTPITSGVEKEGVRASIDTTRAHSNNGCWFMLGVAGCSFSNFFFILFFYSKRI